MLKLDKPRLRNAYRKLQAVEARIAGDFDPVETGQEMLDLLATMAGFKPVFLHGRGLYDPAWMDGVVEVARGLGLRVIQGPCWNSLPPGEAYPAWYVDCVEAEMAPHRPYYICRSMAALEAVQAACDAGGRLSIAEEARLLGYPECCVAAHHAQAAIFHRLVVKWVTEDAEGDEAKMRALYGTEIDLAPRNEAERLLLDEAYDIVPCPFGSWNACPSCQTDEDSPSLFLSADYEALAWEVDHGLHELLMPRAEDDG